MGTVADAWSCGGPPSYFSSPMIQFRSASPYASTMRRRKRAYINRMFEEADKIKQQVQQQQQVQLSSPRYQLVDNEAKFELSVDVPGVSMEDIDVSLEDGYLTVRGQRKTSNDDTGYEFASKFSQTFSLDPAVDVEQFEATLENGVLVVSAPKDYQQIEDNVVKIPVTSASSSSSSSSTTSVSPPKTTTSEETELKSETEKEEVEMKDEEEEQVDEETTTMDLDEPKAEVKDDDAKDESDKPKKEDGEK